MAAIPETLKATVDDFVQLFGEAESAEITNIEETAETQIDYAKLQTELDRAFNIVLSYDAISSLPGKVMIRLQLKHCMLRIARYLIDTVAVRQDVLNDYEACIDMLKEASEPDMQNKQADSSLFDELGLNDFATRPFLIKPGDAGFTIRPADQQGPVF